MLTASPLAKMILQVVSLKDLQGTEDEEKNSGQPADKL